VNVVVVIVEHGMNSVRYVIVILPLVLCGCETRSVTLTEEHGLVVVDCRVLRKVFGPKRDRRDVRMRQLHDSYYVSVFCG
jgi:hypothetical protein